MLHANRSRKAPMLIKFILLLGAVSLLTSCLVKPSDSKPGKDSGPLSNSNPSQVLKPFKIVQGTSYLVAEIVDGKSRKWSSNSYGSSRNTHNLVFLESDSLSSYKLFPTNKFMLLESKQYPESPPRTNRGTTSVTRWFGYRVLTEDTNENGYLDNDDHHSFGISAASGKDYAEVLTGISTWLGSTEVEPGRLLVVYEKNGQKTTSLVDLEQRSVLKSEPLTELGDQMK